VRARLEIEEQGARLKGGGYNGKKKRECESQAVIAEHASISGGRLALAFDAAFVAAAFQAGAFPSCVPRRYIGGWRILPPKDLANWHWGEGWPFHTIS
jgi:hypothetical protein